MLYLLDFSLGTLFAVIGVLPPGILNMTAVKTALEKGSRTSLRFAIGASAIVFFQAFIGMVLAKYLNTLPAFIETLQKAALIILTALAIYFLLKARNHSHKFDDPEPKKGYPFSLGVFLSAINVLAIPYHCAIASYLEVKELITLANPYIPLYSIGASVGTFAVFMVYIRFASFIKNRAGFMARNINYFLCAICLILLLVTTLKLLNYA